MRTISASILATGLFAALLGCDTSTSPASPDATAGDPTGAWALQSFALDDGTIVTVPDPSRYTLDLGVEEDGQSHVRADCNVCGGAYEVSGSALSFGLMACTLAACPPDSLENDYRTAIESTSAFQRSGDELILSYDGGSMRFFAR